MGNSDGRRAGAAAAIIARSPPGETAVPSTQSRQRTAIAPNAESRYQVSASDLPLSCPMPSMSLWNSHPRVYLPIEKTGWAKCPYCSAEFVLER